MTNPLQNHVQSQNISLPNQSSVNLDNNNNNNEKGIPNANQITQNNANNDASPNNVLVKSQQEQPSLEQPQEQVIVPNPKSINPANQEPLLQSNIGLKDQPNIQSNNNIQSNIPSQNQSIKNQDIQKAIPKEEMKRCSDIYQNAMIDNNLSKGIRDVFSTLDNAYDDFNFSRKGEEINKQEFSQGMYRTMLLKGAHIVFEDGGELFNSLQEKGGMCKDKPQADGKFFDRGGASSHYWEYTKDATDEQKNCAHASTYKCKAELEMNGLYPQRKEYIQTKQMGADIGLAAKASGFKHDLGHLLIGLDWEGNTFVQFEKHGYSGLTEKALHGVDYFDHSYSEDQIGPQGDFDATEKQGNKSLLTKSAVVVKNINSYGIPYLNKGLDQLGRQQIENYSHEKLSFAREASHFIATPQEIEDVSNHNNNNSNNNNLNNGLMISSSSSAYSKEIVDNHNNSLLNNNNNIPSNHSNSANNNNDDKKEVKLNVNPVNNNNNNDPLDDLELD
ncbi:hypothetical protein [Chitinimonas lacunae]|uniref:Uncharacterized protein n=1 Tax=Chitinimonas lacunae TaxID=1963018 RepID=A0ABV8MK64_9NEIS